MERHAWQPGCEHDEAPIPALVLDPFLGSGTTAEVATRHRRHWLGFELNPDYLALVAERLGAVQMQLPIV